MKSQAQEIGQASERAWWTRLSQRLRLPPRFRPQLNLQSILIVPYAVLTLVTATVGIYVVIQLVTSSFRERFANQITEASRVAADGIVRRERIHLEDLRLMAFTEGVPQAFSGRDVQTLQTLLGPVAQNNNIEVVTAVDLEGQELITLARGPDGSPRAISQGADFAQWDLVRNILQSRSDALGDKFIDLLTISNGSYLFTSAPVREESRLVGVLMIGTRLETLNAELKSQALADVIVLDRRGALLATTLTKPDEGYAALELRPEAAPGPDASLTRDLKLYGRDFQALYAPLVLRQQMIGALAVVLPSNYIVSATATSRNSISLIFALGTMAVIFAGYLLSQSIVRPILRLRAMSQAVAAGDLQQSAGLERTDEIGELASAFDTMTLRLRERTEEANRLYTETVQRNKELADINARLQATQQQLVQSEKLAAIGQLTAGIVHDVKNPLAVIKGLAEVLLDDPQHDPETQAHLVSIRDSASKANQIVSDLLKFARQSKVERTHRDLRETVQAALRLTKYLAGKAHVQSVAELPDQPLWLTYDAQQIEQVLINMIHNAIQAMPEGGTLRLRASNSADYVTVMIQDTGTGIAPENLNRIFDPFFTTKPEGEGTGLGLSVSYGIVSDHGGYIEVVSKLDEGTTFTISLPVRRVDLEEAGE